MNDVSVDSYLQKGYLKEAILNFVALLGWHSSDDREIYSLEELCEAFELERVNKAGAIFDITKLDWMNGQYLRSLPLETIAMRALPWFDSQLVQDTDKYHRIIAAARERSTLLPELADYAQMFLSPASLSDKDLDFIHNQSSQQVLKWYLDALQSLSGIDEDAIAELTNRGLAELGIKGKNYYMPLRLALIGQPHGPDMPTTVSILGKDEAIKRLGSFILN
jgi:glutamyl/glutaminyl-tRNA synthetase